MENQLNLPNSPGMRGELLAAIKRLAYERFIQLELGTDADFEKLWREAFFTNGKLEPAVKNEKAESVLSFHEWQK